MARCRGILFTAAVLAILSACAPGRVAPPQIVPMAAARVEDARDSYHGVTVIDPYRWLEDGDDPAVKAWSRAQNVYARSRLDAMPVRAAVSRRITELIAGGESVAYHSLSVTGDRLFAMKDDPRLQQAQLISMAADGGGGDVRIVLDPNVLDPTGSTTIDWRQVSHNGKLAAVSVSAGGSETGDVHVLDVATGREVSAVVPNVQRGTAGGDLAWLADDSGFYYTRYPRPGERSADDAAFFQQVWLHKLNESPDRDVYVLGQTFPRIAEIRLFENAGRLLISVQDGDSSRFQHHLRQTDGRVVQLSDFDDGLAQVIFGPNGKLYGLSWARDLKGEIVETSAQTPDFRHARTLISAGADAIGHSFYDLYSPTIMAKGERLYIVYQAGGPTELRVFDLAGHRLTGPAQEPVSAVFEVTDAGAHGVYFSTTSYVTSKRWSAFDGRTTRALAISSKETVDYSDVKVLREYATSKDGTQIPVNILMPKDAQPDATRAIVVTGYGGYGLSSTPGLSRSRHILFENGVLFAEANIRGGGEYGESWHRAGMLTSKQNCYDDFIAVVEHLLARGYADPRRVGIVGGSNGGMMMGAILTQRPDIATAVVSHVGVYDVVRSELEPNGEFNVPELGTVKDPAQFAAIYAYSPYHHVVSGARYPAILLTSGANDPRVNPLHSRKFAARLQAAQAGDAPILLTAEENAGHGIGASVQQDINSRTDQYAFFFDRLGVTMR